LFRPLNCINPTGYTARRALTLNETPNEEKSNDTGNKQHTSDIRPTSNAKTPGRKIGRHMEGVTGQVRYEWMEGGFFLMQHVDLDDNKGLEIIGQLRLFGEAPSEDIKSRYYGSMGATFDYVYELDGDTLTIWGGEKGSPAYYRGTFSSDGNTLSGAWVYPGGGYESTSMRVK
jgi:hypothetical protein